MVVDETDDRADPDAVAAAVSDTASVPPRPDDAREEFASRPRHLRRLTHAELRQNQRFMTILHFMITYPRWSLSIFLLLASRTLYLPNASVGVQQPIHDLNFVAQQESLLYFQCVRDAFDNLVERLNATAMQEYHRIQSLHNQNNETLSRSQHVSQQCFDASVAARRMLQVWQQDQIVLPLVLDTNVCTALDRNNLTQLLLNGRDYGLTESAATDAWGDYATVSESALQHVVNYAEIRASYDYNYFIGVKIEATLAHLGSVTVPELTLPQLDVLDELLALLQAILDVLHDAYIRIDIVTARLAEFQVSIQAFYVNYRDIYGRLSLAADFVADFLPSGVPLPPYLDLQGIPLPDVLLPSVFGIPTFLTELPSIDGLVSDYLQQLIEVIQRFLAELEEAVEEQLRIVLEALLEELRGLLTLEDYNPPQYVGSQADVGSPADEVELVERFGLSTKQRLQQALDNLQSFAGAVSLDSFDPPGLNVTGPSFDGDSATLFGYLEPRFPTFYIPAFIQTLFTWIIVNQWIIELVIQFVRLRRLIRHYERNAVPDLPEIDFGDEEEETFNTSTIAVVQVTVLKHFVTPWMAFGLILLPFAILATSVWFPHVKRGCVDSRNGTVIGRNLLAPLIINKANVAGNALYASAELECSRRRRRICNRMYSDSDLLHRTHEGSLLVARQQLDTSSSIIDLLSRCVDASALDALIQPSCCGLEGYGVNCGGGNDPALCPIDNSTMPPEAFLLLTHYLATPSCSSNLSATELIDSRFDCEVLEGVCASFPCTGVNSKVLRRLTIETDCQVEVYIIKCCLLVLIAVYHATMLNLCSSLVFSSIKHLRWRALKPDGIMLRTRMFENGHLAKGADQDERSARIAAAIRRFEITGWVQLVLAVVIFLFWFSSFFLLRHLLAPFNRT